MEAAKSPTREIDQRKNPGSDRCFAVILREIIGKQGEKDAIAKLRLLINDSSVLSCVWDYRKRAISKTIERQAWDLEAVGKLTNLLTLDAGGDSAVIEQLEEIRQELLSASEIAIILDQLLAQEALSPTGLLQHSKIAGHFLGAWLSLEIKLRPDERGLLAGLRDRLVRAAEHREIDMRGLGI